jgi:isoquinoline 1-oxidoreductase beta subunit
MSANITRRQFLRESLAATGMTIAVSITPFGYRLLSAAQAGQDAAFQPNVWIEITPDNVVTITVPNSEMGQGVHTALPMIVADELEAEWKQIKIVQSGAGKEYGNPALGGGQVTVASASCRGHYMPLRKAGAAGRAMLIAAAAATWKVPKNECKAYEGTVRHKKSGKSLTFGQLSLKAATLPVPQDAPLKKESEFRYIGKSMPRVDIPDKVSGKAIFGMDIDIPDMCYAVLARPPAFGAKPISYDQNAAMQVKGVRKVVPAPMGIIVCAETLWAAWEGRDALNVKWDKGSHPALDNAFIYKVFMDDLAHKKGAVAVNKGDAKGALAQAAEKVEGTYFTAYISHATIEPMNCTAHVQKDRCDVWAPTQNQTASQGIASGISGLPPEKVHIHTTYLGCGLGRRATPDYVVEAVIASKAVGRPVKVIWTREEDMQQGLYRPAMAHRVTAGMDSQGRLNGWSHKAVCSSIIKGMDPKDPLLVNKGLDYFALWGIWDPTPNDNNMTYEIPNFYVEEVLPNLPIPCCPLRSVQNAPNAFVVESFMDELAHAAGKDPLEFRLQLLKNNRRATRVLQTVAEKAGWGKPGLGQGRGIAQHYCFWTHVAAVADVSVDKSDGAVKVHRIVFAVDCGPVINPDPLVAQFEGGGILALSTALKEQVMFSNGGVKSANYDDYSIMKMSEIPKIEVHIVQSTDRVGGIGELPMPATAPSVANAIFDATGARVRRLPMNPETVLAAVKRV